jgi:hypothetical protein
MVSCGQAFVPYRSQASDQLYQKRTIDPLSTASRNQPNRVDKEGLLILHIAIEPTDWRIAAVVEDYPFRV